MFRIILEYLQIAVVDSLVRESSTPWSTMYETGPVLYVEDNQNDVILLKRALAGIQSRLPLQVIMDGLSAWEFLSGQGSTSRPPYPSLILLDLKLPRKSGMEILSHLKQHDELRKVPVVVMSSSRERADVDGAYRLGADFYLVKRVDLSGLRELASAIQAYWIALVGDPDHCGSDPTLARLRRLSEPAEPEGVQIACGSWSRDQARQG